MDSFTTQPQGFKPFNTSPCPGCAQGAVPGQTGMTMPPSPLRTGMPSQMPTGVPTGPYYGTGPQPGTMPLQGQGMTPAAQQVPGMMPQTQPQELAPIVPWNQPMPVTTESLQYMNGFMRTQIGRRVTVEFLIGTNTLVDRTGTLLAVGANYILINEVETDDILMADFYSIKFMRFYY